jgi:predicted DCC family thiol-disulfide oxidoreductase YuxK
VRVLRRLDGAWPLLGRLAQAIPAGLRDALYRWIARNRYRWFGQRESCMLPTPEDRARFIE